MIHRFFDGGGRRRRPSRTWTWIYAVLWSLHDRALHVAERLLFARLTVRDCGPKVKPLLRAWIKRVRGGVITIPESERRAYRVE